MPQGSFAPALRSRAWLGVSFRPLSVPGLLLRALSWVASLAFFGGPFYLLPWQSLLFLVRLAAVLVASSSPPSNL